MGKRGFPGPFASQLKPSWAAMMLGFSPCEVKSGALEGRGIDERIGQFAEILGKPVYSIEDYRTVMHLLDDLPQEQQLEMIRLFLEWPGNPEDLSYTVRQGYLSQKMALVWAYTEWMSEQDGTKEIFAEFERRLLTERNESWVALLNDTDLVSPVFIAVGAAHLPGENGLLNLLAKDGFEVSRLPFNP